MSAAPYTPDEARRYRLPPLPEPPFCGDGEAARLRAIYEAQRRIYRAAFPDRSREDCA